MIPLLQTIVAILMASSLALAGCNGYAGRPACGAYVNSEGRSVDGTVCQTRLTGELRLDPAWSTEEQVALVSAADEWNRVTGGVVDPKVSVSDEPNVLRGCTDQIYNWGHSAVADSFVGAICIYPSADLYTLRALALHEIGHHIGLGHASDAGEIMYPFLGVGEITPADLDHFRKLIIAQNASGRDHD